MTTAKEPRSPRLWNAATLIAGFIVGVMLLNLLGLAVAPLARFTVTDVVLHGFGLLWLCGAWVLGTWLVTLVIRHVLHVHTTWFG